VKSFEKVVDAKRAAKVDWDKNGAHLMTMNNGFQWCGAPIYSVEVAKAAVVVLQQYIEEKEK